MQSLGLSATVIVALCLALFHSVDAQRQRGDGDSTSSRTGGRSVRTSSTQTADVPQVRNAGPSSFSHNTHDDDDDQDTDPDACVYVRSSGYYYGSTAVSSCEFAERLENNITQIAENLDDTNEDIATLFDLVEGVVMTVPGEIADLRGENTDMSPKLYLSPEKQIRWICELYTFNEASELCKTLGYTNANPHFIHRPCGDEEGNVRCPETTWKIRQDCYRPNDPSEVMFEPFFPPSPLFDCFYDPVGETCDRILWLSCDGYTQNFDFVNQTRVDEIFDMFEDMPSGMMELDN